MGLIRFVLSCFKGSVHSEGDGGTETPSAVDLARLRRLAEAAEQRAAAGQGHKSEQEQEAMFQKQRLRLDREWAAARLAVLELPRTLEQMAHRGLRSGKIYETLFDEFFLGHDDSKGASPKGSGRLRTLGMNYGTVLDMHQTRSCDHPGLPDYFRFVFDECLRLGLSASWGLNVSRTAHYLGGSGEPEKIHIDVRF